MWRVGFYTKIIQIGEIKWNLEMRSIKDHGGARAVNQQLLNNYGSSHELGNMSYTDYVKTYDNRHFLIIVFELRALRSLLYD